MFFASTSYAGTSAKIPIYLCYNCKTKILNCLLPFLHTVSPKVCFDGCICYHSVENRANTYDCCDQNLTGLPENIINSTDWLLLSENNLGNIQQAKYYLSEINHLDMSSSHLDGIGDDVMVALITHLKFFDVSSNNLTNLSPKIREMGRDTELRLFNNPFECNCDMVWMKDWLMEAKNVKEKENITCSNGKFKGTY